MNSGDIAISYVLFAYIGGTLVLAVAVSIGAMISRHAQARRFAELASEPSADVAEVMREVDSAIQTAELELQDFSERSGADRHVQELRVLEDLARVDALYHRLGALRPPMTASYSPTIAKLHSLAAKNGLHPPPSRG